MRYVFALIIVTLFIFATTKNEKPVTVSVCTEVTSFQPYPARDFGTEYSAMLESGKDTVFAVVNDIQMSSHQLYKMEIHRFKGKMPIIVSAERVTESWRCQRSK